MTINNANHLFIEVRRYVRHRERMMLAYGAVKTKERMETVSRMLNLLDHFTNADSHTKCKVILRHLYLLKRLAAGAGSRYYTSDINKLADFGQFCKNQLANAKSGVA